MISVKKKKKKQKHFTAFLTMCCEPKSVGYEIKSSRMKPRELLKELLEEPPPPAQSNRATQ